MEGNKSKPRALLVFGAPCSGKSTFSEKFADKFDLAVYDFEELKVKYRLTRKNILLIVKLIARTGKTIIIEGCLGTEREREEIRNLLKSAGYEVSLVWIQTDVSTIRSRLKARYKSVAKAKEVYDAEVNVLEAPSELEDPIILSGKHTFETQTRHVLAGLAEISR
ncbi:MAG: AAA family ATPase [Candidatus Saccharibacteria bacterium]|nr:AAA family ATPase [Candidatus Saccharibacteria bacterium]